MFKRWIVCLAVLVALLLPATSALAGGGSGHGTAAAAENHEKPPLLPDPTSRQTIMSALWVVIIFVALLAILYPTAWKSVLAGLKAREERIRKDIADAEAARAQAEQTLRQYAAQLATAEDKVRQMLASATAEGEKLATAIRARGQQEAEETKERAVRDIEAASKQAVTEIHEHAAELAIAAAERILRRNLTVEDQRELVRSSLQQLEQTNRG